MLASAAAVEQSGGTRTDSDALAAPIRALRTAVKAQWRSVLGHGASAAL